MKSWKDLRIRTKLLIFYAATIVFIVLLNVFTNYNAFEYIRTINQNLTGYLDIHQIKSTLDVNHQAIDSYLRERRSQDMETFYSTIPKLWNQIEEADNRILGGSPYTNLPVYFQLNAIRAGTTAYLNLASEAIRKRNQGEEDFWLSYVRAEHVLNYVQIYVSTLLNIRMNEGVEANKALLDQANRIRFISFFLVFVVGTFLLSVSVLFANSVSRPIRRLERLSSRISSGKFDSGEIAVESQDEIGKLTITFNEMSRSIRLLVEGLQEKADLEKRLHDEELMIEKMGRSLQEAQFLGLQSQINPHFLFNTLNTIARTAAVEEASQTMALIHSLAKVFRYNLRNHDKPVRLTEELTILEEYLSIQKSRYGDRLHYSIHSTVCTDNIYLPCFTLQPFVENAMKYGIEPKEAGGFIRIEVRRRKETTLITIKDNGVGMDRKTLNAVMHDHEGVYKGQTSGIGIGNVVNRLNLHFGGDERISMQSKLNEGTTVRITIPEERREMLYVPAAHS